MSGCSVSGAMLQTIQTSTIERQGQDLARDWRWDQERVQRRHVRKEYRDGLRVRR